MSIVTARRISQVFFVVLFFWFCVVSTLGDLPWQLRGWPVNWLLELDPLVGIATLLVHAHALRRPAVGTCDRRPHPRSGAGVLRLDLPVRGDAPVPGMAGPTPEKTGRPAGGEPLPARPGDQILHPGFFPDRRHPAAGRLAVVGVAADRASRPAAARPSLGQPDPSAAGRPRRPGPLAAAPLVRRGVADRRCVSGRPLSQPPRPAFLLPLCLPARRAPRRLEPLCHLAHRPQGGGVHRLPAV